jgi:hypothetical protein
MLKSCPLLVAGFAIVVASSFTGCSTPGPNHAYIAADHGADILDIAASLPATEANVAVPSFLFSVNTLYGVAYDPFTDHLFLRAGQGNFIRVVDRPARKIKRDFTVASLPPGPGDLAIRSRDRHLFFVHPTEPVLVETNLEGRFIRTITLAALTAPPAGLAYDQNRDEFLVLLGGDLARVVTYDLQGKRLHAVALDRDVRLTTLAFDSVAREVYAPLLTEPAIGIFNREGHLLRTLPLAADQPRDRVDVGARSLLRLF